MEFSVGDEVVTSSGYKCKVVYASEWKGICGTVHNRYACLFPDGNLRIKDEDKLLRATAQIKIIVDNTNNEIVGTTCNKFDNETIKENMKQCQSIDVRVITVDVDLTGGE